VTRVELIKLVLLTAMEAICCNRGEMDKINEKMTGKIASLRIGSWKGLHIHRCMKETNYSFVDWT